MTVLFFVFSSLLLLVFLLLSVAFYTLFERKVLSLVQARVGPNKFGFWGVLQPVVDGINLILKEMVFTESSNKVSLLLFPAFIFSLIMLLWSVLPSFFVLSGLVFGFFYLLVLIGVMVFFIMLLALVTSSKYASIGSMRSASQSVSYEICLSLLLLVPFILSHCVSFSKFFHFNLGVGVLVFVLWWLSCLMECNRAPFDFAEGESELISGFNVEYSSLGFVFIFLGEYGIILFFSCFTSLVFFSSGFVFILLFSSIIVARASFPRYRYDLLIKLCWLVVLPPSVFYIFMVLYF